MCDGTVVMGCTELEGETPDDSDFDAQNGHTHDLLDADDEVMLEDRYHTHICETAWPNHILTPEIQAYTSCETSF